MFDEEGVRDMIFCGDVFFVVGKVCNSMKCSVDISI